MTDKPNNALQVVSRDLLERLHGWLTHIHHYRAEDMADLEAALKHAPALGGEPEMLQAIEDAMWNCYRYGKRDFRGCTKEEIEETRAIVRASLAPYQAEIERLRVELDAYKESRERLHGWIREEQVKNIHLTARLAARPAPVLPQRRRHFENNEPGRQPYQNGSIDGWNACLDDFARLNTPQ